MGISWPNWGRKKNSSVGTVTVHWRSLTWTVQLAQSLFTDVLLPEQFSWLSHCSLTFSYMNSSVGSVTVHWRSLTWTVQLAQSLFTDVLLPEQFSWLSHCSLTFSYMHSSVGSVTVHWRSLTWTVQLAQSLFTDVLLPEQFSWLSHCSLTFSYMHSSVGSVTVHWRSSYLNSSVGTVTVHLRSLTWTVQLAQSLFTDVLLPEQFSWLSHCSLTFSYMHSSVGSVTVHWRSLTWTVQLAQSLFTDVLLPEQFSWLSHCSLTLSYLNSSVGSVTVHWRSSYLSCSRTFCRFSGEQAISSEDVSLISCEPSLVTPSLFTNLPTPYNYRRLQDFPPGVSRCFCSWNQSTILHIPEVMLVYTERKGVVAGTQKKVTTTYPPALSTSLPM